MRLRLGPASVSIERGDITDWEVDAIINAANTSLAMGTGVAGAIKRKGGVIIEEEALRQGPVEIGEAVLTTGGNLAATHVIHGAVMGLDLKTDGAGPGRQASADVHRVAGAGDRGGPRAAAGLGRRDAERSGEPPQAWGVEPPPGGLRPLSGRSLPCLF
jgi:O-acetyl-ADP-ribose deacetylase (regulator of RNase III)